MFNIIYLEKEIENHFRVVEIKKRFSKTPVILCDRYGEVFNRKSQNFRLQKQSPSLILAKKYGNLILETPPGYGIGGDHNFYFSHMLNCIYDCRYCFLQGMYRSAHYVIFVNFEDFQTEIEKTVMQFSGKSCYFFSGYDCDSLALEPITHFIELFLPLFRKYENAFLELRTKSTNIQFLLENDPLNNVIVAFTLSPTEVVKEYEHRTPSLERRLQAIEKLQSHGWPIGIRFDPVIGINDFEKIYSSFFSEVFKKVDLDNLHSVTMGAFRLPKKMYQNMVKLYPDEKLFTFGIERKVDIGSEVLKYIPEAKFFPCEVI